MTPLRTSQSPPLETATSKRCTSTASTVGITRNWPIPMPNAKASGQPCGVPSVSNLGLPLTGAAAANGHGQPVESTLASAALPRPDRAPLSGSSGNLPLPLVRGRHFQRSLGAPNKDVPTPQSLLLPLPFPALLLQPPQGRGKPTLQGLLVLLRALVLPPFRSRLASAGESVPGRLAPRG